VTLFRTAKTFCVSEARRASDSGALNTGRVGWKSWTFSVGATTGDARAGDLLRIAGQHRRTAFCGPRRAGVASSVACNDGRAPEQTVLRPGLWALGVSSAEISGGVSPGIIWRSRRVTGGVAARSPRFLLFGVRGGKVGVAGRIGAVLGVWRSARGLARTVR
jgi:hypothetical protein